MASQLVSRDSLHVRELPAIRTWRVILHLFQGPHYILSCNWMHQLPVHLPNNGKRPGIGDGRGLEEISPKRILDRHWKRGRGFVPIPRDDLLRTACTILVVTPLHLGILSPPLSVSPFRLFCRSLGTLAPPRLGGSGKPGLVVRMYSRSYPIRWNTGSMTPSKLIPDSTTAFLRSDAQSWVNSSELIWWASDSNEGPLDGNDDALSCVPVLVVRVLNSSL